MRERHLNGHHRFDLVARLNALDHRQGSVDLGLERKRALAASQNVQEAGDLGFDERCRYRAERDPRLRPPSCLVGVREADDRAGPFVLANPQFGRRKFRLDEILGYPHAPFFPRGGRHRRRGGTASGGAYRPRRSSQRRCIECVRVVHCFTPSLSARSSRANRALCAASRRRQKLRAASGVKGACRRCSRIAPFVCCRGALSGQASGRRCSASMPFSRSVLWRGTGETARR